MWSSDFHSEKCTSKYFCSAYFKAECKACEEPWCAQHGYSGMQVSLSISLKDLVVVDSCGLHKGVGPAPGGNVNKAWWRGLVASLHGREDPAWPPSCGALQWSHVGIS